MKNAETILMLITTYLKGTYGAGVYTNMRTSTISCALHGRVFTLKVTIHRKTTVLVKVFGSGQPIRSTTLRVDARASGSYVRVVTFIDECIEKMRKGEL